MENLCKIVLVSIALIAVAYASQNSGSPVPESALQLQRSTEQKNKTIVRQMIKGLSDQNQRDYRQVFDKFYDRDFVQHINLFARAEKTLTLEDCELACGLVRRAFAGLQYVVEDIIGEGDKVAVRWTIRVKAEERTDSYAKGDKDAQGRKILTREISIYRIAKERIVEEWAEGDVQDPFFLQTVTLRK